MSLPYPTKVVLPFDIATAQDMNERHANDVALASGTGLDDGAVNAAKIDFTTGIWWEELGRTTLSSTGDVIDVNGLPARKHLRIIFTGLPSGAIVGNLTFNGDTGSNYASRYSSNGSTETTNVSQSLISVVSGGTGPHLTVIDVHNPQSYEKAFVFATTETGTAGAGNLPGRREGAGKWANTSTQITRVTLTNSAAGDYAAGSEVVVLGHD